MLVKDILKDCLKEVAIQTGSLESEIEKEGSQQSTEKMEHIDYILVAPEIALSCIKANVYNAQVT